MYALKVEIVRGNVWCIRGVCHLRNHVCTANRSRQRNNKSDDSGKSLRIEKVSHNNIKLIDRREGVTRKCVRFEGQSDHPLDQVFTMRCFGTSA